MDDVKALFALFAMAMFANVLDKRTYMPLVSGVDEPSPTELEDQKVSDINAIPLLERRHYAYGRGLANDLLNWFLNQFGFRDTTDEDPDVVFANISIPFIGQLASYMVGYKSDAEDIDIPGVCTQDDFSAQVDMALARFDDMADAFDAFQQGGEFDIADYTLVKYDTPQKLFTPADDFFTSGQTTADEKFFAALDGEI